MSFEERSPTHNLEAERRVLGSMLLDDSTIFDVADRLEAGDFFRDVHQELYRAILGIHQAGRQVDTQILVEDLARRRCLDKVGGEEYVKDLVEGTPSAVDAAYCADIVRQKAIGRELLSAADQIRRDVTSGLHDSDQLTELAERRIFAVGERQSRAEPRRIDAINRECHEQFLARKANPLAGVLATGFCDLDGYLGGGMRPGQMIIAAARPSMGKTAFGLSVACNAGNQPGSTGVLFASLEMKATDIIDRYRSMVSGVELRKIREPGFASNDDARRLAAVDPGDMPFWIDEQASLTVPQIAGLARRYKAKRGVGLLVVDYLQNIMPEDERRPRQEQVAKMSRQLKAISMQLSIPVLVLAQLNRKNEDRADRRPLLADLRESGQIEQDADVVLLLHRPEYYDPNDKPGRAEVIVAKNRNGATGSADLIFRKECTLFLDADPVVNDPMF